MAVPAGENDAGSQAVDAPAAEATKRSSEESPAGEPPAKAVKTEEVKSELKEELKDEIKEEIKKEGSEAKTESEKKEKKEKKEHKEGKEDKKDKKEKHKDKDKKDKKEHSHKEKKEKLPSASPDKLPSASPESVRMSPDADAPRKDLDQRKLFKDGQRFLTPPVADATRAFYESLYEENDQSKIAIRFAVEYGLYPADVHKKIYKRYTHLKEKGTYDARILIAKSLAKGMSKDKDKKDKKEKSEKKEKKEKSEKEAGDTVVATTN